MEPTQADLCLVRQRSTHVNTVTPSFVSAALERPCGPWVLATAPQRSCTGTLHPGATPCHSLIQSTVFLGQDISEKFLDNTFKSVIQVHGTRAQHIAPCRGKTHLRVRFWGTEHEHNTSRLAGTVVGHASVRLALLASDAGVQSLSGACARTPSRTTSPVGSVAPPDESRAVGACEIAWKNLHLTHAFANNPCAALLTLTQGVEPCPFSATTVVYASGAGYFQPLHAFSPAHGRPEVRVWPLEVQHCAALSAP